MSYQQKIKKEVIENMIRGLVSFSCSNGDAHERYVNGLKEGIHLGKTRDKETLKGIEDGIRTARALEFVTVIDVEPNKVKGMK